MMRKNIKLKRERTRKMRAMEVRMRPPTKCTTMEGTTETEYELCMEYTCLRVLKVRSFGTDERENSWRSSRVIGS